MSTVTISSKDELQTDKLTVVKFSAVWCGPCKMVSPIYEKTASLHGDVVFANVDIDQATEFTQASGVRGVPSVLIFKNGQIVDRITGTFSVQALDELVKKHK